MGTIEVHVVQFGGEACTLNVNPSAKLFDVMTAIHQHLGYTPHTQKLLLCETVLADANAILKDIGVTDGSTLGLVVCGPIGQNCLEQPEGKKEFQKREILDSLDSLDPWTSRLTEFQLMSWQAACKADQDQRRDLNGKSGSIWSDV